MPRVLEPDLLLRRDETPVVLVEAKALPVGGNFVEPVRVQIRMLIEETGSPWAMLIDPVLTTIFRAGMPDEHRIEIPTAELLVATGEADREYIGDRRS